MTAKVQERLDAHVPLSDQLREGTLSVHRRAERTGFVRAFMKGELTTRRYVQLLSALQPIYAALEAQLALHQHHRVVRAVYYPQLFRSAALSADIAFFSTKGDRLEDDPPLTSARRYAERILTLGEECPALLVAHAYTRYLGDLSGGQALAKAVCRTFDASRAQGAAFYHFAQIEDPSAFKHQFRASLDAVTLDEGHRDAIVAEANRAFEHNIALFDELQVALPLRS